MDLKRISPEEAKKLMDEEDYILLDVRSIPEYAAGHAEGAYNVPFLHKTPVGMVPNPDFAKVVQRLAPDPTSKLITACQMGGRSVRAAVELQTLGYGNVVDMRGGYGGERDETGRVVIKGWADSGLPTGTGETAERSYELLLEKVDGNEPAAQAQSGPQAPPRAPTHPPGPNRFASDRRKVKCAKLGKELPGLKRRPFPGELGTRIFETISAEAWNLWVEQSKMIINEYRIRTTDERAMGLLMDHCEQFLFGDGSQAPEGYVPPEAQS